MFTELIVYYAQFVFFYFYFSGMMQFSADCHAMILFSASLQFSAHVTFHFVGRCSFCVDVIFSVSDARGLGRRLRHFQFLPHSMLGLLHIVSKTQWFVCVSLGWLSLMLCYDMFILYLRPLYDYQAKTAKIESPSGTKRALGDEPEARD